jgi:hypothetical protein
MKNKILLFVLGLLVFMATVHWTNSWADSTDRSAEYILNRVFDSTTDTLRITS